MILPGPFRTISTTPLRVVTVVPDEISVLPIVGAEYDVAEFIATQAEPDHTDIIPVAELK